MINDSSILPEYMTRSAFYAQLSKISAISEPTYRRRIAELSTAGTITVKAEAGKVWLRTADLLHVCDALKINLPDCYNTPGNVSRETPVACHIPVTPDTQSPSNDSLSPIDSLSPPPEVSKSPENDLFLENLTGGGGNSLSPVNLSVNALQASPMPVRPISTTIIERPDAPHSIEPRYSDSLQVTVGGMVHRLASIEEEALKREKAYQDRRAEDRRDAVKMTETLDRMQSMAGAQEAAYRSLQAKATEIECQLAELRTGQAVIVAQSRRPERSGIDFELPMIEPMRVAAPGVWERFEVWLCIGFRGACLIGVSIWDGGLATRAAERWRQPQLPATQEPLRLHSTRATANRLKRGGVR